MREAAETERDDGREAAETERDDGREAAAIDYRKARDGRSVRALLEKHEYMVQAYSKRLHPPPGSAVGRDDLISAGRYAVVLAAESWDPAKAEWGAYAWCIMRNAMVNTLRKGDYLTRHQRGKKEISMHSIDETNENGYTLADRLADQDVDPSRDIENRSMHSALRHRISSLPVDMQQLLSLRFRHNMWLKEIGKHLGITESAVSYRLKKTLSYMRRKTCDIA